MKKIILLLTIFCPTLCLGQIETFPYGEAPVVPSTPGNEPRWEIDRRPFKVKILKNENSKDKKKLVAKTEIKIPDNNKNTNNVAQNTSFSNKVTTMSVPLSQIAQDRMVPDMKTGVIVSDTKAVTPQVIITPEMQNSIENNLGNIINQCKTNSNQVACQKQEEYNAWCKINAKDCIEERKEIAKRLIAQTKQCLKNDCSN